MFFDIQTLEKRKIPFDQAFPPGVIDLPDENTRQTGDLRANGTAELIDPFGAREIRVRGELRGEVEMLCARCLAPVRSPISCSMDLFYRPMKEIAKDEEVSISRAETEIGFYEGGGLELADVVREQIAIELPMRSLCREDCRGLCPVCGKNRNNEACICQETIADTRWEALRKWKH
jgi:uncharacterized protein